MKKGYGFVPVLHAATDNRPDEVDTLLAAEAVAAALEHLGYATTVMNVGLDLTALERLKEQPVTAVFNLVDAIYGDDRLIGIVPAVLEHLGIAFTGGGAEAFAATLSKCRTKQLLRGIGLPTPDWSVDGAGCDGKARYIVKADIQHGSLGMDETSVVTGVNTAHEIALRSERHDTGFFAERFIEGREFNVALIGNGNDIRILPIQEIVFEGFPADRPRIVDYAAKWDASHIAYHTTVRKFGVEALEPVLAGRLSEISLAVWRALSLKGYVRVDFRVDENGSPLVLEVNVNPAITPDAGLVAAAFEAGINYQELVAMILAEAVGQSKSARKALLRKHA